MKRQTTRIAHTMKVCLTAVAAVVCASQNANADDCEITGIRVGGMPGDTYIGSVCNGNGTTHRTCFYLSGENLPDQNPEYKALIDGVEYPIIGVLTDGTYRVVCPTNMPPGVGHDVFIQLEAGCSIDAPDLYDSCGLCPDADCGRIDDSQKGSLLIYSKVDLRWDASGALTQDTVLSLTNDYPDDVYVQMYFVNGDAELDPILAGDPPMLIAEGEPGWNWVDCALLLTQDQPIYWSAATGLPAGCQPFTILDPDNGNGPGRPNPEANDGSRVLRGFVLAWAVDSEGFPIRWNHLSGKGTIIDYANTAAWEYNAFASQVVQPIDNGQPVILPDGFGYLALDGRSYEPGFDLLLLDFMASGAQMEVAGANTTFDTDLTLHPITADLRQETYGPITTKANFDIWNMEERKFSGTHRCITCWDQALVSNYDAPRTFLIDNLQSDKGKARIDGIKSQVCDVNCINEEQPGDGSNWLSGPSNQTAGVSDLLDLDVVCSQDASLLGIAAKMISFSGPGSGRASAGSNLVGQGYESAYILYDAITPPDELRDDADALIDRESAKHSSRVITSTRNEKRKNAE